MKHFMKKHINKNTIWWLFVLFFFVSITYASTSWTLWDLFEFISSWGENGNSVVNVYRLDWENIKDDTVTSYEIKNGTIQSEDIWLSQITSFHIKDWTIESEDIWIWQITNLHIVDWTITNNNIATWTITENLLDPNLVWSFWKWEEKGDNIYYNSWSVWIWTDTPNSELEVIWNITSDLPLANTHVATKEYVDNVALAADTTDGNTSWWMSCYYAYPKSKWCWNWFFQMPWSYVSTNRSSAIYEHIICCTQTETQKITIGWKSIYAFSDNWQHYVTTPSGCSDKVDNPICIWKDFVIKTQFSAINYCDDLVYDWYDDWRLPDDNEIRMMREILYLSENSPYDTLYWTSFVYCYRPYDDYNINWMTGSYFFRCIRQL